ncbi:hypothetical protein WG68_10150 [Arsukibacterium ikkense]|uniref:Type II secretion system protein GspB C-terminal domain-containing protein n=1 Tax=Arsukibacterium ikkense TaxID=336831 RepID=A0A0M2V8B4_9GAMM|nr:general secretion pathway protein GspB [Arsukibacterium ikkense]KKO45408.1 hypothetical protein WG68_10150 [Arsukibacterium ikkense]
MSILMDALKQQVEPTLASPQPTNGWRNLALLLGFLLALSLGFVLASWWQSANTALPDSSVVAVLQHKPVLADSASIVAALTSAEPAAQAAAVVQSQPKQEPFAPEQKVVRVTAPEPTAQAAATEVPRPVSPEPEVEVSAELRQRFASAMAASEINQRQPQAALRSSGAPARDISELAAALQRQIPPLRFEAHVYATQSQQRWIKVNGKSLQEGQWVTADIRLKEITPQFVLLEMGAELFSVPALTDYK